jgi:hypothetical protein
MKVYEKVRAVPPEALKEIKGGRLKGMSDINPMWRIKMLTETFGMCGIGWKTEITDRRLEHGHGDEVVCFVDINLYVKVDGEWSAPIPGMGGSSFITLERNGVYTSDECYKMAYTDAISVACKSLGFAADVYFASDRTKYSQKGEEQEAQPQQNAQKPAQAQQTTQQQQTPTNSNVTAINNNMITDKQLSFLLREINRCKVNPEAVKAKFMFNSSKDIKKSQFNEILTWVQHGGDQIAEGDLPF